jgi:hypothetical protein
LVGNLHREKKKQKTLIYIGSWNRAALIVGGVVFAGSQEFNNMLQADDGLHTFFHGYQYDSHSCCRTRLITGGNHSMDEVWLENSVKEGLLAILVGKWKRKGPGAFHGVDNKRGNSKKEQQY